MVLIDDDGGPAMLPSANQRKIKFDYESFGSLSTSDLVAYMEPILNDPTALVDPIDLDSIAAEFQSFDEYHLVYAIELGTERMPSIFAVRTAHCLSHACQSVRLAAHRALSHLPARAITDELIETCRTAIGSGAPIDEVGDLPEILRHRQQLAIV